MTEYKMQGGIVYTEKDICELADACERGDYPGEPGRWIMKPKERFVGPVDQHGQDVLPLGE